MPSGLQLYQKETQTQVLSYEYWEIYKNTYFEEYLWTTTSDLVKVQSEVKSIVYIVKLPNKRQI